MSIPPRLRSPRRATWASLALATVVGLTWLAWLSADDTPKGEGRPASNPGEKSVRLAPAVRRPFFRAAHGGYGGSRLTPARVGARYRLMILQYYDKRFIPRLKAANHDLKVLMYVDMMSSDPRDPHGAADWAGYPDAIANHPDWFLRDRDGSRLVFKDYPTSRVMDVGNRHYQDAGAARVISIARAYGFDGVFLDSANASLRWVIAGGEAACVTYPTTARWQAAVHSFLSNIGPRLRRAGLLVLANIGGSTITPGLWQRWNAFMDGAMEESFTNGGTGPDSIANGQWPAKLKNAQWSEKNGKISLSHALTPTRRGARYGLATMLLVARRHGLFSASVDYTSEVWWPEYGTASSLGRPIGRYRVLPNGVYRRDFTNGVVLVNPRVRRARTVRLGGTYSGSGLHEVTAASLLPTSGVVLLKR
jgi:hypothetical protein